MKDYLSIVVDKVNTKDYNFSIELGNWQDKKIVKKGFKQARSEAVQCLKDGSLRLEKRSNKEKNLLFKYHTVDEVVLLTDQLIDILNQCSGNDCTIERLDRDNSIEVYILKPILKNVKWYIKFYFEIPMVVVISFHISNKE